MFWCLCGYSVVLDGQVLPQGGLILCQHILLPLYLAMVAPSG